ncbi:hypothetical protein INT47_006188 [Mucor saturninus]|uniref:Protein ARV n=1 Tax=Mucor saturninus TaxID=64648 RepID=A0A8H7RDN1_9FUNG|nr:hypothetical protein INT47_006188 [Mucor saturninus]
MTSTCVECGNSVQNLYTQYSKDNIRLTTCNNRTRRGRTACVQVCNTADPFRDIKWFRLERYYTEYDSKFIQQPLYYQYLYILALCIFEFIVFHCCINVAIRWYFRNQEKRIRYNYVSMALIISSFGKMLLILMVIWDYKQLEYSWLVSIIVLASNTEALSGMGVIRK